MGPRKGSVDPYIELTEPPLFNLKLTKKQIPNQALNIERLPRRPAPAGHLAITT